MLGCIHIRKKIDNTIYEELKHLCIVLKIPYKKFPPIEIKLLFKNPKSWGACSMIHELKNSYN